MLSDAAGRAAIPDGEDRDGVAHGGELLVGPLDDVVRLHRQEPVRSGDVVGGDETAERIGCQPGVGVEEQDALAGRRRGAGVTGPRLAEPSVGRGRRGQHAGAGGAGDFGGGVGGAVVHHQHLEWRLVLRREG